MDKKVCTSCKIEKDFDSFPLVLYKGTRVPYSWCRECKNERHKQVGKKWKALNKEKVYLYDCKSREKKKEVINNLRTSCLKCGEVRKYLIQFHHITPENKKFNPLDNYQISLKKIIEEIKKCVPLCCNCHCEFHFLERQKKITLNEYLNAENIN